MICKLCKEEGKKLAKAHLIPKCFHKFLPRNEKGQFFRITRDGKTRPIQDGDWDNKILCVDCDRKIGIYDEYARSIFHDPKKIQVEKTEKTDNGDKFYVLSNIDYTKFKLFLVSLFWRASITDRKSFSDVKLGEKIEEDIRCMLLEKKPKNQLDYPTLIITFPNIEKFKNINYINQPSIHRMASYEVPRGNKFNGTTLFYMMVINNFKIMFFPSKINNQKMTKQLKNSAVDNNGRMIIHMYTESDALTEYGKVPKIHENYGK